MSVSVTLEERFVRFSSVDLRFSRNKSVTRTVISVNRLFIMRYISCKHAFFPLHFRYSCGHCLASMPYIPIARASSSRRDKFYHRITKFCTKFCPFASFTYPFPSVTKPLGTRGMALCSHKLGAHQLHSYHAGELPLCFCKYKKQVFS